MRLKKEMRSLQNDRETGNVCERWDVRDMKKCRRVNTVVRGSLVVVQLFFLVFLVVFFSGVHVVKAADTTVSVNPVSQTVVAGAVLNVTILCTPGQPVKAFELKISFNPSLLRATAVTEGDFFEGFTTFFNPGVIDNTAGTIVNIYDLIVGAGNVTGAGSVILINFTAKSLNGTSPLGLYDVRVTNESAYVAVSVSSGSVTVTGGSAPPVTPPPSEPPNTPSSDNSPPATPRKPVGSALVTTGTMYNYSSAARDPDGDQVRLRFDWGDGSLSNWTEFVTSNTTVYASHVWGTVSNTTLRVIAQDLDGVNSSWSEPLLVNVSLGGSAGSLPVGMFTVPENASSNQTIVFDASGSYDPDGAIVSYQWDFGDGTTAVGENPVHSYQFSGAYLVTLTVVDDDGMTVTMSKVVSIAAGTPTGNGTNFFQSNSGVIVLTAVVIPLLIVLVVYRDRIEQVFVQNRIVASRRRLGLVSSDTVEIDRILDKLFREVNLITPAPSKEMILNAYSDLIVAKVEDNARSPLPALTIDEIEKLVDRRIQSKIEEKVDQL